LEAKPRLKDLHNLVTPRHAAQWRDIGSHLGLQSGLLDIVDYDQQHKAEDCCNMVWEHWLDMDSKACWKKVLDITDGLLLSKQAERCSTSSISHDISPETTNLLQHMYKKDRYKTSEDDWPPYQPEHYASVALIHHKDRLATTKTVISIGKKMHRGEIETRNSVRADQPLNEGSPESNDYLKSCHKTKDISKIFSPFVQFNESPSTILIEGAPGIGKTILSKEIAFRWANGELLVEKKLLLVMFLRDPNIQKLSSFSDLAKFISCSHVHNEMVESLTYYFENSAGENMAIIFDGYDELPKELRQNSFVANLINRKFLPLCSLIITSRPTASACLHKVVERRVEILGFTEEDRKEYIYHSLQENQIEIEKVLEYLENNPFINSLCYIPLNMTILICLLKENDGSRLPKNQTEMNNQFACITISRCLRKEGCTFLSTGSLSSLIQPYKKQILQLSKLAFVFLRMDKIVFSISDITLECPKLLSAVKRFNGLGLLKAVQYFSTAKNCEETLFNFLHFSLQEFLAAFYIASSSNKIQVHMLEEYFWDSRYLNMWIMYAGLTGGDSLVLKHFLSGNRFMWFSRLFGAQQLAHNTINNKIKCLHLFQCFLEAGNDTMCHKVGNFLHNNIIDLSNQPLMLKDLVTLSFFLTRSSTKKWTILNLSNCFIGDKNFQMFSRLILESHPKALHIEIVNVTNNFFTVASLPVIYSLIHCLKIEKVILSENNIPDVTITEYFFKNGLKTMAPLFIINSEDCVINPEQKVVASKTNLEIYLIDCCLKEEIIKKFKPANKVYLWNTRIQVALIKSILYLRTSLKISLFEMGLLDEDVDEIVLGLQIMNLQGYYATEEIDYVLASEKKLIAYRTNLRIFPSIISMKLSSIQLSFCEITMEVIDHFGKALCNSSQQWESVELIHCNINDNYLMALINHFSSGTSVYIKQLNLSNNHITSSVIPGFLKLLQFCVIEKLNLSDNSISDKILNKAIYSQVLFNEDFANFTNKIPLAIAKDVVTFNNERENSLTVFAINCQINERIGDLLEAEYGVVNLVLFNNHMKENDFDIIASSMCAHSKCFAKIIMFDVGLEDITATSIANKLNELQCDNYLFETQCILLSETMLIASRVTEEHFIALMQHHDFMVSFKMLPMQCKSSDKNLETIVFNECNPYTLQLENVFNCLLNHRQKVYLKMLDLSKSYLTVASLGSIVNVLQCCAVDQLAISGTSISNPVLCDAISSCINAEQSLLNFELKIPLLIVNSVEDSEEQQVNTTENIFAVNCECDEKLISLLKRILNYDQKFSFKFFLINNNLQLNDVDAIAAIVQEVAPQVHLSVFAICLTDSVGMSLANKLKYFQNLTRNYQGSPQSLDFIVISSTVFTSRRNTQHNMQKNPNLTTMSWTMDLNSMVSLMHEESLKCLETIDLSGCGITDTWLKEFCYTIVRNKFKRLDLSNNKLTNSSASIIIKLLEHCIIEFLDISSNFIKDEQLSSVIYLCLLEGDQHFKNFTFNSPLVIVNSKENLTDNNQLSLTNYAYTFLINSKLNEGVEHIFNTLLEGEIELYRLVLMDNDLHLTDVDVVLSILYKWAHLEVNIVENEIKEDTASRLVKGIHNFLEDTNLITKKVMYIFHSKTQLLSNDAPISSIVSSLSSNSSVVTLQASCRSKRKVQVRRILPVILNSCRVWNMIDLSFCNMDDRDFKMLSDICSEYAQTKQSYTKSQCPKESPLTVRVEVLNLSVNNTTSSAFTYVSQIASILSVQNMVISVEIPISITSLCLKFFGSVQNGEKNKSANLILVNGDEVLIAYCDPHNTNMTIQKIASVTATEITNYSVNCWKLSYAKVLADRVSFQVIEKQKQITSISLYNNNLDVHSLKNCITAFTSPHVDMIVQEENFLYKNKIIFLKFHYSIKSCNEEFTTYQCNTVGDSSHSIAVQLPDSKAKQTNTFTGTMPIELILYVAKDKLYRGQLRQFAISNTDISNELADKIVEIINENPELESIEFKNNNLQNDGFMKIANSLKDLKHLQCLILNYNKISAIVAEILSNIIEVTQLHHLEMSHCSLGDREMVAIVKSLANTASLIQVNFCSSPIANVATYFLSPVLSNNPSLTHINLSDCDLQEQNITLILLALQFTSIKKLDLNFNVISGNTALGIAQLKSIEHLGLSYCSLQYSELCLIAKAAESMKSLSYSHNSITDTGLATLLWNTKHLEHLELAHCKITEHSFATIMKELSQQQNLKHLDMKSAQFYIKEIAYFTGMLWSNGYLEFLDLSNCSLKEEFVIKICEVLSECLSLKHLDLSHNQLTDECAVSISKVVNSNLDLQHVSLHHGTLTINGVRTVVTTVIKTCDLRDCFCLLLSNNLLCSEEILSIKALLPKYGTIQLCL